MSRASRWAERQKDEVQVDRPRFESVTVEAWVTDKGELAIWHKAVLGAKDAVMTPPETALALSEWIDAIFSEDALDSLWHVRVAEGAIVELDTRPELPVAEPYTAAERIFGPAPQSRLEEVGGRMRWVA